MPTTKKPAESGRTSKLLAAGRKLAAANRDRQVQAQKPQQPLQQAPDAQPEAIPGGRPVNPRDLLQ